MYIRNIGLAVTLASLVGGCSFFGGPAQKETDTDAIQRAEDPYHTAAKYNPYTGYNPKTQEGVGVNSYLWRATLDTVSFMPLASADPFGGVIITDWYSPAESPAERFKMNVFILSRELRADGVRATVFRQKRDPSGQWVDAAVEPQTGIDLENAILTRARQLRLSTASK
jgi:Domain of unknown function (DUF3576)